jgi:hypothetical protein
MGELQVSKTTRIVELVHRICVLGPCFVAIIVAATSVYPGGYMIAFIFVRSTGPFLLLYLYFLSPPPPAALIANLYLLIRVDLL